MDNIRNYKKQLEDLRNDYKDSQDVLCNLIDAQAGDGWTSERADEITSGQEYVKILNADIAKIKQMIEENESKLSLLKQADA